jgi:hypothetical protein
VDAEKQNEFRSPNMSSLSAAHIWRALEESPPEFVSVAASRHCALYVRISSLYHAVLFSRLSELQINLFLLL